MASTKELELQIQQLQAQNELLKSVQAPAARQPGDRMWQMQWGYFEEKTLESADLPDHAFGRDQHGQRAPYPGYGRDLGKCKIRTFVESDANGRRTRFAPTDAVIADSEKRAGIGPENAGFKVCGYVG